MLQFRKNYFDCSMMSPEKAAFTNTVRLSRRFLISTATAKSFSYFLNGIRCHVKPGSVNILSVSLNITCVIHILSQRAELESFQSRAL